MTARGYSLLIQDILQRMRSNEKEKAEFTSWLLANPNAMSKTTITDRMQALNRLSDELRVRLKLHRAGDLQPFRFKRW